MKKILFAFIFLLSFLFFNYKLNSAVQQTLKDIVVVSVNVDSETCTITYQVCPQGLAEYSITRCARTALSTKDTILAQALTYVQALESR